MYSFRKNGHSGIEEWTTEEARTGISAGVKEALTTMVVLRMKGKIQTQETGARTDTAYLLSGCEGHRERGGEMDLCASNLRHCQGELGRWNLLWETRTMISVWERHPACGWWCSCGLQGKARTRKDKDGKWAHGEWEESEKQVVRPYAEHLSRCLLILPSRPSKEWGNTLRKIK